MSFERPEHVLIEQVKTALAGGLCVAVDCDLLTDWACESLGLTTRPDHRTHDTIRTVYRANAIFILSAPAESDAPLDVANFGRSLAHCAARDGAVIVYLQSLIDAVSRTVPDPAPMPAE